MPASKPVTADLGQDLPHLLAFLAVMESIFPESVSMELLDLLEKARDNPLARQLLAEKIASVQATPPLR